MVTFTVHVVVIVRKYFSARLVTHPCVSMFSTSNILVHAFIKLPKIRVTLSGFSYGAMLIWQWLHYTMWQFVSKRKHFRQL